MRVLAEILQNATIPINREAAQRIPAFRSVFSGGKMIAGSVSRHGEAHDSASPQASAAEFRDPTKVTRVLKAALLISIVTDVVAIGSGLLELQLLQAFQAGEFTSSTADADADANDLRQRIVGWTQIAVLVATVIGFSRWIYIVNDNKRRLGAHGLGFTPGWAVGWFFVPFANLWKPYQAMKEAWQVSADPFLWQQQFRGRILPWWWFLWLASNILGQAAFRLSLSATEFAQLVTANIVATVANCASLAAACVAMALVAQMSRMQLDRKRRWDALVEHDEKIKLIIEKLRTLGEKWVDRFLSSYLAMNDRSGLPDLVKGIIADARTEEEHRGKVTADNENQVPCDLDPLDGRRGPYEYRGRNFYSYPDGRVDGYTRAAGWWRFLSLQEFEGQVDDELDKARR